MGLPDYSVKKPVTICMIFLGIVLVGVVSVMRLPVELMPNTSFGVISIFTDIRGGMPPNEVENLVSRPIEESVGAVTYLKNVISISEEGRSIVQLSFEPGIDMDLARLEVSEKFSRVKTKLPSEIEKPIIAKYEQAQYPVLIVAIAGEGYNPEALRKMVDDFIKERIQRVQGVANIEIGGGRERKILVEANPAKLAAYHLPITQLINMLNLNNLNLLVGDIKQVREKYLLRTVGEYQSIDDIGQIGISMSPQGSIIRVKDVAEIRDSFLEATSFARVNVLPVVNLYIQKESSANTISVVEGVQKELDELKKILDPKIRLITTYNQSESIKRAIKSVRDSLIQGGLLAILILFLFLRDWRSVSIIGLSIPISVIGTFIFMYFYKVTLNVMTLSGLALGTGMLVDNSIVVLENIFVKRNKGMSPNEAAISGSEEMVLAIVASTLTTIVVFIPIVFINKEIRMLYAGLATTITFSLICSLFTALTLAPMLSAKLGAIQLGKKAKGVDVLKSKFFIVFKRNYRRIMAFAIRYRLRLLIGMFALFGVAMFIFATKVEKEFIGAAEEEDVTIFVELPTGAKLGVSDQVVARVEKILKEVPEIKTITARVEPWSSKVYVKLKPLAERKRSVREVINSLRPEMERIQPAFIYFEEPQAVEANEVILDIYGFDYDVLTQIAEAISARLGSIKGLTDVKIRHRPGRPEYRIKVDKEKAAAFGMTVEELANVVHAQMRGLRATLYRTESKEVEVIVRVAPKYRRTLEELKKLIIVLPDGRQIFLEQAAKIQQGLGPSKIWRKNKNRMIQVSANRGKYAFGTAVSVIREAIRDVKFPDNYFYKFGENYEKMVQNQNELRFALLLVVILIYLVLASLFESYIQPFIIMTTVPMGTIGVVLALRLLSMPVNVGVLMGMMMLGGIVVNNAIIMVDHINYLRGQGRAKMRALFSSGQDRLRPVMMTTSTTVLGLVPMAMDRSPEAVFWSPLAITVMAGLIFSTVMTLIFLPSIYLILEDIKDASVRWIASSLRALDAKRHGRSNPADESAIASP